MNARSGAKAEEDQAEDKKGRLQPGSDGITDVRSGRTRHGTARSSTSSTEMCTSNKNTMDGTVFDDILGT